MTVRVLYFAALKDFAGSPEEVLEVPDGADVAALWALARERHPRLREIGFRPLAACDMSYADWDHSLRGISEVAFLPPVSGG